MNNLSDFQQIATKELALFAQSQQLAGYPLDSGNGVEYKNYLNDTVFTVYHDRLDDNNIDRIEVAIGTDNIALEVGCAASYVHNWFESLLKRFHPAERKHPQLWPRLALWFSSEIEQFCQEVESLYTQAQPVGDVYPVHAETQQSKSSIPVIDDVVMRQIMTRRGQENFRRSLFDAYSACCAISGCIDAEVLEAAHILPHSETQDYRVSNGLLLRADIHTLFDLLLVSIDPRSARVVVSRRLSAAYQMFSGRTLYIPQEAAAHPDPSALMLHYLAWQANEHVVTTSAFEKMLRKCA